MHAAAGRPRGFWPRQAPYLMLFVCFVCKEAMGTGTGTGTDAEGRTGRFFLANIITQVHWTDFVCILNYKENVLKLFNFTDIVLEI